jgi:hypothetical protein
MLFREIINHKEHEEDIHKGRRDNNYFVDFAKDFATFAVKINLQYFR